VGDEDLAEDELEASLRQLPLSGEGERIDLQELSMRGHCMSDSRCGQAL
jgi:hypothetical protein